GPPQELQYLVGEAQAAPVCADGAAGSSSLGSMPITAQAGIQASARGAGQGATALTEPITQLPALQPHQQHLLENLSPRQQ
ncbi:DNA-binding response regulator, partial [Burkholderia sp. SIMBA_052]